MQSLPERLVRCLARALSRSQCRFQKARPASILVMVVALLVLLTLMGTAYIVTARLDRAGSVQIQSIGQLGDLADSLLQSQSESIKTLIAQDHSPVTGIGTPDPNVNANNTYAKGTPWLAPSVPMLLTTWPTAVTALPPLALSSGGGVAWRTVSRLANTSFESPLGISGAPDSTITNYDTTQDLASWFRATNIAVYYDGSLAQTDPALVGQTRVFPAFRKTAFDLTSSSDFSNSLDFNNDQWIDDKNVYIAADATGAGIANCGLFRLTQTPFQGVTFFGGIYIVDNAASINVNTAWSSQADLDPYGNCFNFFPNDIDLAGFLNKANPQEMALINNLRYRGIDTAIPPVADDAGARPDVAYLNNADAFYHQYVRRLNNPNYRANAGDPTNRFLRPFTEADTAALRYRGGMVNQSTGRSRFDGNMFQQANDSIYHAALNFAAKADNQFKFVAANNVEYWYDWNFNIDGFQSGPQLSIGNRLGAALNGSPFRSPRSLLVANNPVKNIARELDPSASPQIPAHAFTGIDAMLPADPVLPHKTSLNTAPFGDLYRTFATAFTDPVLNANGFQIATDEPQNPGVNTGIFRNPLRDPTIGVSAGGPGTAANKARYRFDSFNVALLRAAIAAVNVETLRDNHGTNVGNFFYPDSTRRIINLKTTNGTNVQAAIYGVTPQVFITEVYANTDQSVHGGTVSDKTGPSGNNTAPTVHGGVRNPNGIVAIRLYNPYPYPLDLKDYKLVLVDRRANGSYPAMKVTPLDPTPPATPLPIVPANSCIVISNYKSNGSGTDALYLPSGLTGANWTYWPRLYRVLEDRATGTSGGELTLLKPMTPGGIAEVPVDSFDFTGLPLNSPPDEWHYARIQGASGVTFSGDPGWKFVYPGIYEAGNAKGGIGHETPRQEGVTTKSILPVLGSGDVSFAVGPVLPGVVTPSRYYYGNKYPGIQLCNVDFGGFNKPTGGTTPRKFPFGGFARTGDVIQATFIGSYVIAPSPIMGANTHQLPTSVMEMNPVTMDSMYVDDADSSDDAYETLGRFVPIRFGAIDDYSPYGYYGTAVPNPDPNAPPGGMTVTVAARSNVTTRPHWRYHFAMNLLNSFTALSNPHDDMLPNYAANSYVPSPGGKYPSAVPNTIATASNPNGSGEAHLPVEGLISINTASWQVLSAIEWSPPAAKRTKSNEEVAKLIVRYRDVDDGYRRSTGPRGHGPFNSIMELNAVFDPCLPGSYFANSFGPLPPNGIPDITWGNYTPGPGIAGTYLENRLSHDFMSKTLMVSRVSNLLTTRSDSFTAYIIVQGWKNVGTPYPELVIQKRAAFLVDRSGVTAANKAVTSYSIPTR